MPTPGEPAEKTGKLSLFYKRHEMKIARAEVVIIFHGRRIGDVSAGVAVCARALGFTAGWPTAGERGQRDSRERPPVRFDHW